MKEASGTRWLRLRLLSWTIQTKILKILMIRHLAAARILLWDLEQNRQQFMTSPRLIRRVALVMAAVQAFESNGGTVTNETLHAKRVAGYDLEGPGANCG